MAVPFDAPSGSPETSGSLAASLSSLCISPSSSLLQMKGIRPDMFVHEVDGQFYCGICNLVLRYPMQTSCGCRFCYGCIQNYISGKKGTKCVSCEEELDHSEIVRDNYSRKQLEKLQSYCWNKNNGCSEQMKLKELSVHLESCHYENVPCVHKSQGCTAVLMRSQLAGHLQNECQFRQGDCELCGEKFPVADLKAHHEKCKSYLVKCPNNCTPNGVHQDKMDTHLQIDCPLAKVRCFFYGYGCKYETLRKDMRTHKIGNASDHLQLMVRWWEETRLKMTETQHLIQEITNNSGIMESKMQTFTNDLSSVQTAAKKTENHVRELQKLIAKQSDQMDTIETQIRQAAKNEDVVEMKKTMFKPLQEKQDRMDDRLKRLERGDTYPGGGGGGGEGAANEGERQGSGRGVVSNARMVSVENQMGMHAVRLAEHELRFQIMETTNYEGVLLWKIKDFARRKRDADSGKTLSLYSQPFYTSRYGYKMCARIYLNGDGMGKGTHVSLFFVVMRGDYDALLPWPFRQKVTLMLLDQETGRRHLSDSFRPDPKSSSFKRPTTEMNIASGCPLFVNQNVLKDSAYMNDDVIFLKIIVDTSDLYGP
ncbi:TNF receptor-associated factor 3-like [Amphiura filiformis]|uniref:TNF receptor-associated factor 3-like n=1 Tax=Amphiura filiformis TaxID=82378 RepID=UPI003B21CF42